MLTPRQAMCERQERNFRGEQYAVLAPSLSSWRLANSRSWSKELPPPPVAGDKKYAGATDGLSLWRFNGFRFEQYAEARDKLSLWRLANSRSKSKDLPPLRQLTLMGVWSKELPSRSWSKALSPQRPASQIVQHRSRPMWRQRLPELNSMEANGFSGAGCSGDEARGSRDLSGAGCSGEADGYESLVSPLSPSATEIQLTSSSDADTRTEVRKNKSDSMRLKIQSTVNRLISASLFWDEECDWESVFAYSVYEDVNPNITDLRNGMTTLHECAFAGESGVLRWCLERGAVVSARTLTGRSALHFACEGNRVECVRILLEGKADPNERSLSGSTPLHFCCACSSYDAAMVLLHETDELIDFAAEDQRRQTPAMLTNRQVLHEAIEGYAAAIDERRRRSCDKRGLRDALQQTDGDCTTDAGTNVGSNLDSDTEADSCSASGSKSQTETPTVSPTKPPGGQNRQPKGPMQAFVLCPAQTAMQAPTPDLAQT